MLAELPILHCRGELRGCRNFCWKAESANCWIDGLGFSLGRGKKSGPTPLAYLIAMLAQQPHLPTRQPIGGLGLGGIGTDWMSSPSRSNVFRAAFLSCCACLTVTAPELGCSQQHQPSKIRYPHPLSQHLPLSRFRLKPSIDCAKLYVSSSRDDGCRECSDPDPSASSKHASVTFLSTALEDGALTPLFPTQHRRLLSLTSPSSIKASSEPFHHTKRHHAWRRRQDGRLPCLLCSQGEAGR